MERLHRFYSKGACVSHTDEASARAKAYLDEPDCSRFFAETLTTEVEAVFTNETCLVRTEAARDADADARRGWGGWAEYRGRCRCVVLGEGGRVNMGKWCKCRWDSEDTMAYSQSEKGSTPSARNTERPLTTDDFPCHTCGDERTRQRRASSFILFFASVRRVRRIGT